MIRNRARNRNQRSGNRELLVSITITSTVRLWLSDYDYV